MFSATERSGTPSISWWTKVRPSAEAFCGLLIVTASPSTRIVPSSGATAPASDLISVLLPAPFLPTIATHSPGMTVTSTPSSAFTPG